MRKTNIVMDEQYHIYNRGVEKRSIFEDKEDILRFVHCMRVFNQLYPVGSIWEQRHSKQFGGSTSKSEPLVKIIAYCLNKNHYHMILESCVDDGIQKFMHRLSTGYTRYYNDKYERSGGLFQGRYKSVHIESNAQLLYLSVYVNLNNEVHGDMNPEWFLEVPFSSYKQYSSIKINKDVEVTCVTSIILGQYKNSSEYIKEVNRILPTIINRKEDKRNGLLTQ
jgi:putative transposase